MVKIKCAKCGYSGKKRKMIFLFGFENTEAVVCEKCNSNPQSKGDDKDCQQ
jgi:hypothetical protein